MHQQTQSKIDELDIQTKAVEDKIITQIAGQRELRLKGDTEAADQLQKEIDNEYHLLDIAGQEKQDLLKDQRKKEAKIKEDGEFKNAGDEIKDDIATDQDNGNFEKEYKDRQKLLDLEHTQAVKAATAIGKDTFKIEQEYTHKKEQLNKQHLKAELALAGMHVDRVEKDTKTIMDGLGKQTIAYKVAFKAHQAMQAGKVIIDTYTSVMHIWEGATSMGPWGIALAIAESALAVGAGASSLSQIWSAKGYATGGVYKSDGNGGKLYGPGTGTSDSINARLSHGESIINARSTAMFAPILSALNVAGGGRAFDAPNTGSNFAMGGYFDMGTQASISTGSNIAQIVDTMNQNFESLPAKIGSHIANNMPKQVVVVEDIQAGLSNKAIVQNIKNV